MGPMRLSSPYRWNSISFISESSPFWKSKTLAFSMIRSFVGRFRYLYQSMLQSPANHNLGLGPAVMGADALEDGGIKLHGAA